MFSSTDILRILCKSVILTFVFFIAICFGLDLFKVDIDIANALCNSLEMSTFNVEVSKGKNSRHFNT